MNNRVFWCHSSLDKNLIAPYKSIIEHKGFYCVFDEKDFKPGMYFEEFYNQINSCKYFVVCCSKNLLKSKAALKEIEICQKNKSIKLIPILIEELPISIIKELEKILGEMLFSNVYDRNGLNRFELLFEYENELLKILHESDYFTSLKEKISKDRKEVLLKLMDTILKSVNDETTKMSMIINLSEISNKVMETNKKMEILDSKISKLIDEVNENCHQQSIAVKLP